jgi:hypothetical protein
MNCKRLIYYAYPLVCGYNRKQRGAKILRAVRGLTLFALFVASNALAQYPLSRPEDVAKVERVMDGREKADPLNCYVQTFTPALNFAFRFEVRFIVQCPLSQFQGREMDIASYIRVRPLSGNRIMLGERFHLPAIPPERRAGFNWNRLHSEIEWSGVFAVGEGEYPVDLMVIDDHRVFRKSWRAKASPHGKERKVEVSMSPNTAAPASLLFWPEKDDVAKQKIPRVTLLVDAAPLFPRSLALRAWDRAFLMNSVTSLMRSLQSDSIRLVAFNLDQQREIFRDESFNRRSLRGLFGSLLSLELGTVSYQTLQKQSGWYSLLSKLVNEKPDSADPSNAVIFLGPSNRIIEKLPPEVRESCGSSNTQIFYFKYAAFPGAELPDAIHQLTNSCHGTVYTLHNAGDFAVAIDKMQHKIQGDAAPSGNQ